MILTENYFKAFNFCLFALKNLNIKLFKNQNGDLTKHMTKSNSNFFFIRLKINQTIKQALKNEEGEFP